LAEPALQRTDNGYSLEHHLEREAAQHKWLQALDKAWA